jgi:hypothetical protein
VRDAFRVRGTFAPFSRAAPADDELEEDDD